MSDVRFWVGCAAVFVIAVVLCCVAVEWRDNRCQKAGGTSQYVSGHYLCLSPDGRVIVP